MRIPIWITIGLIISAICVSTLGAYFSIVGLGALFSGAVLAIWFMAGALELSKFVLAAYIHQRWAEIGGAFKYYLTFAIVVLSIITSLGIFGFLSDAYQSASTAITSENIRLETEKNQMEMTKQEIARLNKAIDEVPDARITKKMKIRSEMEPAIAELTKKLASYEQKISSYNLSIVEIQKKVGPLIYISRAFNIEIDAVVKYLIFIFVLVFDPLAICLVIASSQAINSRSFPVPVRVRKPEDEVSEVPAAPAASAAPVIPQPVAPVAPQVIPAAVAQVEPQVQPVAAIPPQPAAVKEIDPFENAEIIEMAFEDAEEIKKLS